MKYILKSTVLSLLFLLSCNSDSDVIEDNLDIEQLTQEEIDDLLFLREEEKLARDVYLFSYDKYNEQIFKNISNSESQHMNSVLKLINKYGLDDSASSIQGVFNNETLQALYNDLTEQHGVEIHLFS